VPGESFSDGQVYHDIRHAVKSKTGGTLAGIGIRVGIRRTGEIRIGGIPNITMVVVVVVMMMIHCNLQLIR